VTDAPLERPTGPPAMVWNVTYYDGTSHRVSTRPGDYVRLAQQYGADWKAREAEAPEMMLYLAWLASRHDPSAARPDFDTFLDDVTELGHVEEAVRPTGAAPGNDSPSNYRLPPAARPVDGSMPTPVPS
jgi:hypothetical protein